MSHSESKLESLVNFIKDMINFDKTIIIFLIILKNILRISYRMNILSLSINQIIQSFKINF